MKKLDTEIVVKKSERVPLHFRHDNIVTKKPHIWFRKEVNSYKEPIILPGYEPIITDNWKTGWVIQNQEDGSELVSVPVGWLKANGTVNGITYFHRFGRRNYDPYCGLEEIGYHEELDHDFWNSIKKYGVFYIARYQASKENGKLVFKKGNMPWTDINQPDSECLAREYTEGNKYLASCEVSGAAFDTICEWIIESGEKTYKEVTENSNSWGNYEKFNVPIPTGSNENYCACKIYDLAGNANEWSTEVREKWNVVRGGFAYHSVSTVYKRKLQLPDDANSVTTFRAVVYPVVN